MTLKVDQMKIEQRLDEAFSVTPASGEFIESLWENLSTGKQKSASAIHPLLRWAIAGIIAAVLLILGMLNSEAIVTFAQTYLKFLPGIGAVETLDGAKVLAEERSVTREGVTVTLKQVSQAQGRIWLRLQYSGYTFKQLPDDGARLYASPSIRGEDGTILPASGCDFYAADTLYGDCQYPAAAVTGDSGTVLISALPGSELQFGDSPAELGFELRPAAEIDMLPPALSLVQQGPGIEGFSLSVPQVLQTPQYTFITFRVQTPNLDYIVLPLWHNDFSIRDSEGTVVPYEVAAVHYTQNAMTVRTAPLNPELTYTASFTMLDYSLSYNIPGVAPSFEFDPTLFTDEKPHLETDILLSAPEYDLKITSMDFSELDGEYPLIIRGEYTRGSVFTVGFDCPDLPLCKSVEWSGNSFLNPSKEFTALIVFNQRPAEKLIVPVRGIGGLIKGDWQVSWQPVASPFAVQPLPTSLPTAVPAVTVTVTGEPSATSPTEILTDESARYTGLAKEVYGLLHKGYTHLYSQPGWIWTQTHTEDEAMLIPADSTTWSEVDAEQRFTRSIWTTTDKDGKVEIQSLRRGRFILNKNGITYEEFMPDVPRMLDLPDRIQYPDSFYASVEVTSEETTLDTVPVLLVSLTSRFREPTLLNGTLTVSATREQFWISRNSGQLLQKSLQYLGEDMSALNGGTLTRTSSARVEAPPANLMAALEKVPGDGTYKQYTGENGVLYKDLAAAVYEMLYKGFMYYYGQPGWVHRSYTLGKRTFGSELSMFDNQTLEIWEKVEADRSISQYYELIKADDGTVISELARLDGKTTFLAGNPIETGLERWGQAHMPDLPDRIAAPLDGESCSGSMESFGASPTFNASCRRDYRSALQKPSIPFEFWHYSRDWTIAPNTGVITHINDSYSDAAWKQSWQEEIELLTIERADEPPVEILEKLK